MANEQNLEKRFFLLLDYENILACFNTVFADAEDFRKRPVVINRNFVDHGMMTKKVIRKDCVQLFLLYYKKLQLSIGTTIYLQLSRDFLSR